jgi:hypothetical protein
VLRPGGIPGLIAVLFHQARPLGISFFEESYHVTLKFHGDILIEVKIDLPVVHIPGRDIHRQKDPHRNPQGTIAVILRKIFSRFLLEGPFWCAFEAKK